MLRMNVAGLGQRVGFVCWVFAAPEDHVLLHLSLSGFPFGLISGSCWGCLFYCMLFRGGVVLDEPS
jgi:hypothetical protein